MSTPINDAVVPGQATRSSDRLGAPDTRLRGRKLILARVLWLVAVTLIVVPFLVKLLANYTFLQTACTGATCGFGQLTLDSAQTMQKLGLYAAFVLALTLALALFCFTLGAVIFWRKSDDWMALLVALMVVATVTLNENAVFGNYSAWGVLGNALYILGSGVYVLVLSLFPDGRFVPQWAPWLLLCWAVSGTATLFFPDAFFGFTIYNLVWRAALVLILIAQVYRYRTTLSPLQRQQTKWILFGGSVVLIIDVGLIVPTYIFPSLEQAGSFYELVAAPIFIVISLIFPLCLGLAILRYRLWDIDLIIRRTLVYSTLTVLLAVIYEVSVFTLQSLTSSLTFIRGNQLAIIASTFLIGGLFKPLYDRIRALIDRRFYRRKYDAARTVAAFSATIRDEVDLNQLCTKLTAVVQETMQPSHVSLWLCPPKRYLEETTRALPFIETVDKP
ncbi:MAG TPA: hypothetical protein VKB35_03315 [Ktedonobacteraceae bacterium]|nr:hypothetical protein [Ktedonobacteraceae bacterium]